MIVLVALVVVIGVGGWMGYQALREQSAHSISPSYAFDVSDRTQVAGYADHILIGRVNDIKNVDGGEGPPQSVFTVEVMETLKGSLAGTVRVFQTGRIGGIDSSQMDGEGPVSRNATYLLAVTNSDGRYFSLGGPHVPQLLSTQAKRDAAVDTWTDAIANQRWPLDLPPRR